MGSDVLLADSDEVSLAPNRKDDLTRRCYQIFLSVLTVESSRVESRRVQGEEPSPSAGGERALGEIGNTAPHVTISRIVRGSLACGIHQLSIHVACAQVERKTSLKLIGTLRSASTLNGWLDGSLFAHIKHSLAIVCATGKQSY